MTTTHRARTATSCLRGIQPDYIDVDVYVPDGEGEWNFLIFKDVETGRICFGDCLWAENKDACFEETDKDPNILIWIQVIEEMPRVLQTINEVAP